MANNGQSYRRPRKPYPTNQIVLQSKIRTSQGGDELLDFAIPLGLLGELRVSCVIPDEDRNEAPVYIHHHRRKQTK